MPKALYMGCNRAREHSLQGEVVSKSVTTNESRSPLRERAR